MSELTSDLHSAPVKPFRFQDLPAEIRNKIYRNLLTHRSYVLTIYAAILNLPFPTICNFHPNILLTNKAINEEGSSILYGENLFQAHPTFLTAATWAMDPHRLIGSRHLVAKIRRFHIRVRLDCDTYFKPDAIKEAFSGMDVFQIEVFRSSFGLCDYEALEAYAGVRGVKRARVYGSIDDNFAQWLVVCMESDLGTEAVALRAGLQSAEGCA